MKRILLFLSALFIATTAIAHTINWYVDGSVYHTTTCESGENVTPPTAPEKYGYTFRGWLPYIPIGYLESTGTQYIDTGYILNQYYVLEIEYQFIDKLASFGNGWFSASQASNTCYMMPASFSNLCGTPFSVNNVYNFDGPNNTIYFNNEKAFNSTKYTSTGLRCSQFILFTNSNNISTPHNARLYHMKIWKNDVLVRDMVPALDKDNTPCLYDKVERIFYYNQGTGDFIAGPIIGG